MKLKDVIISPKSLDMVIEYAEYDLVVRVKEKNADRFDSHPFLVDH